jgi:uncharacterized protein involved in exopolysaccharide biosynthesis
MNAVIGSPQDGREETLELTEFLRLLWRRRLWVIASVVVCLGGALAVAFTMTPVYRAASLLIPAANAGAGLGSSLGGQLGGLGGIAALAGLKLGSDGDQTEEALAVLRSRQFTETFIREKALMPVLYATEWNAATRTWNSSPGNEPTLAMAYRKFNREIRTVFQDKKTGLVTLQVDWTDRELATAWANELVSRLNAEMRRRAITQADASLKYLEQELSATSAIETRLAINRLVEGQVNSRMVANVTSEYAFRIVDPAMVPDKKDVVRPRKFLMAALGIFCGGVAGVFIVLVFGRPARRVDSPS